MDPPERQPAPRAIWCLKSSRCKAEPYVPLRRRSTFSEALAESLYWGHKVPTGTDTVETLGDNSFTVPLQCDFSALPAGSKDSSAGM